MAQHSAQVYEHVEFDNLSSSVFEPDILLPSQFHGAKEDGLEGGERRLMSAILSDGIESYIEQATNYVKGVSTRIDAIEWVETKDLAYVFSFDNVCSGLGINPEYLRLGLARYVHAIKNPKKGLRKKTVWKKIRRPRKK